MIGRSRKIGRREKNGRLQRPPAEETAWLTKLPTLELRCRMLGWPAILPALKAADQWGGTFPGLLYLGQMLNLRQHEAAIRFAEARAAYLKAIAAPRETCKAASYGASGGRTLVLDRPEADRASVDRYGALCDAAFPHEKAVIWTTVHDQVADYRALSAGLDALADFMSLHEPATMFERTW